MAIGFIITIILFLSKFGGTLEGAIETISVLPGIWLPIFIEFAFWGIILILHLILIKKAWSRHNGKI
jgi:hypothetical protein